MCEAQGYNGNPVCACNPLSQPHTVGVHLGLEALRPGNAASTAQPQSSSLHVFRLCLCGMRVQPSMCMQTLWGSLAIGTGLRLEAFGPGWRHLNKLRGQHSCIPDRHVVQKGKYEMV